MSEAAFDAAREEALGEEPELIEADADTGAEDGQEGEERDPPPKNWEKIAQDKEAGLAAERARRKSAEKARRDLESRLERLEATKATADPLEELAKALRDDDEDPIGDINGLKAVVKTFLNQQKEDAQRLAQASTQQRQIDQIRTAMDDSEADFAAEHADYHDAAKYYRDVREAYWTELGYFGAALNQKLAGELFGGVATALGQGKDPAEVIYNLAKRSGYNPQKNAATDKLEKIANAGEQTRPNGGTGNKGPLSWGDVSKLKGAARDTAFAALRERERRAG